MELANPADGMRHSIAFVPEDRPKDAVFPDLSLAENLTMGHLGPFVRYGSVNHRAVRKAGRDAITEFGVKAASEQVPIASLSGGNQQKISVARWLASPPTPTPAPTPPTESHRPKVPHIVEASGLVVLTVILAIVWALLPDTSRSFPSLANLRVVLLSQAVLVIVTMGALVPLICKQYDFSVGAVCGLSSILAASVLAGGGSLVMAILAGIAVALLVGLVNGVLVTVVGVDSVIVTLGMTTLLAGVATWKTGGLSILSGIPESLLSITNPLVVGVPISFAIALVITIIAGYTMRSTPFGRYLHAIGSNVSAARLIGLPTRRLTLGAFLSVAAIKPGRFNVWGAFVAIMFLAVLNSGLNLMGVSSYVNDFANGIALIAGVSLSAVLGRRQPA